MDEQKQRDIDFLLEFREFRGVVNTKLDRAIDDIKNLSDGTTVKICNLESRVDEIEGRVKTNGAFYKWLVSIAIILTGMVIYILTGYKI